MTPRLIESRRWTARQATKDLISEGKLAAMADLFEAAAIDIGQHGWWKGGWKFECGPFGPKCIWLAVSSQLEIFNRDNPGLVSQAQRYVEWELLSHFGVQSLNEVMDLNDKQPDHEGQGWAIYHLNALAKQLRVRHRLQNDAQKAWKAARD